MGMSALEQGFVCITVGMFLFEERNVPKDRRKEREREIEREREEHCAFVISVVLVLASVFMARR